MIQTGLSVRFGGYRSFPVKCQNGIGKITPRIRGFENFITVQLDYITSGFPKYEKSKQLRAERGPRNDHFFLSKLCIRERSFFK